MKRKQNKAGLQNKREDRARRARGLRIERMIAVVDELDRQIERLVKRRRAIVLRNIW